MPENKKRQVMNAIEGAEVEAAEKQPSKQLLTSYLSTIKEVMKSAGETFDQVVGWGSRLAKIAALVGLTVSSRMFAGLFV
jgi:class 3 adenylate cyclase